jgi:hypothetical protein
MMVPMGGIGDGSDEDCLKILHQVELDLAGGPECDFEGFLFRGNCKHARQVRENI